MLLEVKGIKKSFDGTEVLHGVDFKIESGKAIGLLGRNGAGKTTLIRILMNVFKSNAGTILIDGKPFVASDYSIGYLPEERGLYPKRKVGEQLVYLAKLRGLNQASAKARMIEWLERFNIREYENRLLETLSKGNQQKVQLAQTLLCSPDIIILDEPFSGLDPVNSQTLKDVVKECIKDGKLVIFSSHQMTYVEEFCEEILIMNQGSVVLAGNLKEIKKDYGKNRIFVKFNQVNMDECAQICATYKSVVDVVKQEDGCILSIDEKLHKHDLLKEIINSNNEIEKFMEYEPSLTDIFVAKAGDQ